jgi:hypothetical protein
MNYLKAILIVFAIGAASSYAAAPSQYDIVYRLDAGDGPVQPGKISELTEDSSPASGDWWLLEKSTGELRKMDWSSLVGGIDIDDTTGSLTLDRLTDPVDDMDISMGAYTATFRSSNPAGGFLFYLLGAGSSHFFEILQDTGNPLAGTHLLHIEAVDPDVTELHLSHSGDQASRQLVEAQLDRATPTDDDELYTSYVFNHDGSVTTQGEREFARASIVATDVTEDSEDASWTLDLMQDGTLTEVASISSAGLLTLAGGLDAATLATIDHDSLSGYEADEHIPTRQAATDCTVETGGVSGEYCQELDDNSIYICESGPCDGSGWVLYVTSTGMSSFAVQGDSGSATVTDAEVVDIGGGEGIVTSVTTGSPEQVTIALDVTHRDLSTSVALAAGDIVSATTSGSDITLTLPSSPSTGDQISVTYVSQTAGDIVTLDRNGETIDRLAADMVLYVADTSTGKLDHVTLQYDGTGWLVMRDGRNPHNVRLELSTATATSNPAGWNYGVDFDTVIYDNAALWDSSNYKVVIRRSGYYQIGMALAVHVNLSTGDNFQSKISDVSTNVAYLYCSRESYAGPGTGSASKMSLCGGTLWLDAGDELEASFYAPENTGIAETSLYGGSSTYLTVSERR